MKETPKLNRFIKGFNNVDQDTDLPDGSLRVAENVDLTKQGRVRRRKGYSLIYSGNNIHSLWNNYFFEAGSLKFLNSDNSATTILSGLSDKHLSYCELDDTICFSNEDAIGTIDGPLGVNDVFQDPVCSIIPGAFNAGIYLVSIANTSETGEVGGATNPIILHLLDGQGIQINNIATTGNGGGVRIYVSKPNGETLFEQVNLADGVSSVDLISHRDDLTTCTTLFMSKILSGHIVRFFKGRLYVANGSTLWYSEPQQPGLYRPAYNYFNFSERISIVQETENGIFVVADKTYFLPGTDPSQTQLKLLSMGTGVEGTGITADADDFSLGFVGKVAYWYSSKGAILGLPDGKIKYISEDRVVSVASTNGVTGYREQDGIRQMITNLFEQNSEGSGFGASDNVTAQVIRNGVVV